VPPGKKIKLSDYDPDFTGAYKDKEEAKRKLQEGVEQLVKMQDILYAQDTYALLVVFQAMDAAGKDSAIEHVMSGINPQGCQIYSFKAPSEEELDHDFLWRCMVRLPERGRIGIFNRSYYEETLVVRVHPELLERQKLPAVHNKHIWRDRFEDINNFERHLVRSGIVILKFFLHVSKEEQAQRFLKRINRPEKNWKFSMNDVRERAYWNDYMKAYEDMFNHTSTDWAPWHIIPADHKWFTRVTVAQLIVDKLKSLDLRYPEVSEAQREELLEAKQTLEAEKKGEEVVPQKNKINANSNES
jgi:PPK2 family polyphosphate:nucleotide phosphotransferase